MKESLAVREENLSVPTVIVRDGPPAKTVMKEVVQICGDVKAINTVALSVGKIFDLADYFVVASGRSDRQVQGMANRIIDELTDAGIDVLSVEGIEDGHWVIIDTADVIVHIFYEPLRAHYDLEGLWARAERVAL